MVLDLRPPGERIAVLSPHLDDGILSLGSTIAAWTHADAEVRVVTVLAGRPDSALPAGPWDAKSGFASEGEAARVRRVEDSQACGFVGAMPVWLDYGDEQYGRGGDDDGIWAAVREAVGDASVVVSPGFPLRHADHRWLALLAWSRRDPSWRFGLFVEQPYAMVAGIPRGHNETLGIEPRFDGARPRWRARRAKRDAVLAYRSQHEQLARFGTGTWRDLQRRIAARERRRGEEIAWIE